MRQKLYTLGIHLLFWIAVWFFFYYFFSYNSPDTKYVVWFSSLLLPITIAVSYFSVYYLIPELLFKKKYGKLVLYSFYTLVASSYLVVLSIYFSMILYRDFRPANIPPMIKNFFFIIILVYIVAGLISFVTILSRSFRNEKRIKELENKMLNAQLQLKEQELHYLKKQIHPHFLFNTLNTIYGLALKKSEYTPDVILKLSNLLDYILYEVDQPTVPLKEELEHISDYVELERIRFQESLKVNHNLHEVESTMQIPPMLLIPFVENAFKHGDILEGFLEIQIVAEIHDSNLVFRIDNTATTHEKDGEKAGIGISNCRKRLDMYFPDRYSLEITEKNNRFGVELEIQKLSQEYEKTDQQHHR